MKMVQESATELVYRQGMNVLLLIWSLGFAGIPLVMLIGLFSDSGITRIDCVRPPQQTSIHSPNSFVNCRAQRLTFWGLAPQKAQSIPRVLRAHQVSEITPSKSDCSSMQDHYLLLTADGRNQTKVAVENIYRNCVKGNAARLETLASQLNQFIATQEQTFEATYDNRLSGIHLFFMGLCTPFVLIGGVTLWVATQSTTLRVDKQSGMLVWRQWFLLSPLRQRKFQINDIEAIDVSLHKSGDEACYYQLFIKPKVGQPIELSSSADQDSLKEMADKILEALTMPGATEQQTSPDSLIP
jgi:hypothetical protein